MNTLSSDTKSPKSKKVIILGASDKEERYSFLAFQMLKESGYIPIPVNPRINTVLGEKCYPNIEAIANSSSSNATVDTITIYLSPHNYEVSSLASSIRSINPRRVIFNPGSENEKLKAQLMASNIEVMEACTLVLLRSHQF